MSTPIPVETLSMKAPSKSNHPKKSSTTKDDNIDRPKRPLSAYNLFFKHERQVLLDMLPVRAEGKPRRSHGKIGFKAMATTIGSKWKQIDAETKKKFEALACEDKKRHEREMKEYKIRWFAAWEQKTETLKAEAARTCSAVVTTQAPLPEVISQSSSETLPKDSDDNKKDEEDDSWVFDFEPLPFRREVKHIVTPPPQQHYQELPTYAVVSMSTESLPPYHDQHKSHQEVMRSSNDHNNNIPDSIDDFEPLPFRRREYMIAPTEQREPYPVSPAFDEFYLDHYVLPVEDPEPSMACGEDESAVTQSSHHPVFDF